MLHLNFLHREWFACALAQLDELAFEIVRATDVQNDFEWRRMPRDFAFVKSAHCAHDEIRSAIFGRGLNRLAGASGTWVTIRC